jgi:hypothetical protein
LPINLPEFPRVEVTARIKKLIKILDLKLKSNGDGESYIY